MNEDLSQFERAIDAAIEKHKENPTIDTQSKAMAALDIYEIELDCRNGTKKQYMWIKQQKAIIKSIKQNTQVKSAQHSEQYIKAMDMVKNIDAGVDETTKNMIRMIDEGKTLAQEIRIQLNAQLEKCDEVEYQMRQFDNRWKKVKSGMKTILKNAMANRLTRALLVFLVLAVIGLVVVSILQSKGIIKSLKQ